MNHGMVSVGRELKDVLDPEKNCCHLMTIMKMNTKKS